MPSKCKTQSLGDEFERDVFDLLACCRQHALWQVKPFGSFKEAWLFKNFSRVQLACPVRTEQKAFMHELFSRLVKLVITIETADNVAYFIFCLYTTYKTQRSPAVQIRVSPENCIKLADVKATLMVSICSIPNIRTRINFFAQGQRVHPGQGIIGHITVIDLRTSVRYLCIRRAHLEPFR
jgi:hypothetical protein